jgi:hypothetical protein
MDRNNNNSIVVKGINGTSADRYHVRYLKWKFVFLYGRLPSSCAVVGCQRPFQATAHVLLDDGRRSDDWFLVPQCASHNNHSRNGECVFLRANAKLISLSQVRAIDDRTGYEIKEQFARDSDSDSD